MSAKQIGRMRTGARRERSDLCAGVEEEDHGQTGLGHEGQALIIEAKDVNESPTSRETKASSHLYQRRSMSINVNQCRSPSIESKVD